MSASTNFLIQKVALEVLKSIPYRPFLCLPLSALLYADLVDNHKIDAKLIAGDLSYNGQYIFKQDFKISTVDNSEFRLWAGHAWVEVDDMIWDLSFFRSLYSDKFSRPYKKELLEYFGEGRGLLTLKGRKFAGFEYHPVEFLPDEFASRAIQGIDELLSKDW